MAVYMRDPTGRLVTVDEADVDQALAAGASRADPPEADKSFFESANDAVVGATYGALSGATFGLSDAAIVGNPEDPNIRAHRVKELENIQKNAPVSYGVGNIGATIGLGILSGGASVGSAVARAAPEAALATLGNTVEQGVLRALTRSAGAEAPGILARAAAKGAAVGVGLGAEGAISGAGAAVRDAAFSGQELTAEKLLASSFKGSLIGLSTGGVVGAGGTLLAPIVKKATSFAANRTARKLEDLADLPVKSKGGQKLLDITSAEDLADNVKLARAEAQAGMREIEKRLLPKAQAEGIELLTEAEVTAALEASGQDTTAYEDLAKRSRTLEAVDSALSVARKGKEFKELGESALGLASTAAAVAGGNIAPLVGLAGSKLAGQALRAIARSNPDVVRTMVRGIERWEGRVGDAAAALVSGEGVKRSARGHVRGSLQERFEATKDVLRQIQQPEMLVGRVAAQTRELAETYPDIAGQVQQTLIQDYQYLSSLVPTGYSRTTIGQPEEPVYTSAEMRAVTEAAEALDDPETVLDALTRGDLPSAGLEALRERRPELMAELERTVLEHAAKLGKQLTFRRRMLLSLAFGFQGDWSVKNVQAIQESFAPQEEPEAGGGAPLPSKLGDSMLVEQPRGF